MARVLHVLSVVSRLGALSVQHPASIRSCTFASRSGSKPWVGQNHVHGAKAFNRGSRYSEEMSDEDLGVEDVEDKLQALDEWVSKPVTALISACIISTVTSPMVSREGRKRRQAVKFHMLRRRMTPAGAPQRKLTWSAIQQIRWAALWHRCSSLKQSWVGFQSLKSHPIFRYLKQEQPDEWTVERLAEGFAVTPDVILRVLRSKFVPPPERKAKQDAKVTAGVGQQALASGAPPVEDRLKLTGNQTPARLPPGKAGGPVALVADQALMLQDKSAGSLAPAPLTVLNTQIKGEIRKDALVTRSTEEDTTTDTNLTDQEEASWDGWVWTEEELEEFMEMENPSPVVQVGKDFFDAEGNFLYRIWVNGN